jgi:hypothetical protein
MTSSLPAVIVYGCDRSYNLEHILTMPPTTHLVDGQRSLLGMVLPRWQRQECWTKAMKVRFIEGIFLGLGTGYYVHTQFDWDSDGRRLPNAGLLLDGQQRFTALRDFAADKFSIFDGVTYGSLSLFDRRRRFHRVVFPSIEMACDIEESHLREVYDRAAFGGVPHAPHERASMPVTATA